MTGRKVYPVRAVPEGKFWVVRIDGLPPGMTGVTQALSEDGPDGIETMARECIALQLEVDEDSFDLEITKETHDE